MGVSPSLPECAQDLGLDRRPLQYFPVLLGFRIPVSVPQEGETGKHALVFNHSCLLSIPEGSVVTLHCLSAVPAFLQPSVHAAFPCSDSLIRCWM